MGRFSRGKGGRGLCSRAAKLSARSLDRRQSLARKPFKCCWKSGRHVDEQGIPRL